MALAGSQTTLVFRRSTPAEMMVISSPTGNGSRNVYAALINGFLYISLTEFYMGWRTTGVNGSLRTVGVLGPARQQRGDRECNEKRRNGGECRPEQ